MKRLTSVTFDDGEEVSFVVSSPALVSWGTNLEHLTDAFECTTVEDCETLWLKTRRTSPLKLLEHSGQFDLEVTRNTLAVLFRRTGEFSFDNAQMFLDHYDVSKTICPLADEIAEQVVGIVEVTRRRGGSERLGLARAAAAVPIDANGGVFGSAIAKARRMLQNAPSKS